MCLYDGVCFGPSKKEFVLRKIFRRLLTYAYLYLCNMSVKHIMKYSAVKYMIEDILHYFLKNKKIKLVSEDTIHNQLIYEENLFINKLGNKTTKYTMSELQTVRGFQLK